MARPKANIDWKIVDSLLEASCEGTEVAAYLGLSVNTLYNRCKIDNKCNFSEYLQQKKAKGDSLLKTKQFKVAMDGDKAMLIWLGKQRLNQRDKHDIDNKSSDGSMASKPNIYVLDQKTLEDIQQLENLK